MTRDEQTLAPVFILSPHTGQTRKKVKNYIEWTRQRSREHSTASIRLHIDVMTEHNLVSHARLIFIAGQCIRITPNIGRNALRFPVSDEGA